MPWWGIGVRGRPPVEIRVGPEDSGACPVTATFGGPSDHVWTYLTGRFVELKEVEDLRLIKGIPFPAEVSFRQLVVTGPPGTGKTTLVGEIGGWPEEGYVDLTTRNWWRSKALAYRPRQIHLGLPFAGHRIGLSMFESEWLESPEPPELEVDRIQLPPLKGRWNPWKLRDKYAFEFLLPPAPEVFSARTARFERQSHVIDEDITLERVEAQVAAYAEVAHHFHHAGMQVFVRDQFGGVPKVFAEPPAARAVEEMATRRGSRRSVLEGYIRRAMSPSGYRVLDRFDRVELRGKKALIPRRSLPVELSVGPQTLRLYPERPSEPRAGPAQGVRIFDPERYFSEVSPFVRLLPGDMVRLPEAGLITPDLPSDIPPRFEISNEGAWLSVVDLDSPSGTSIRALSEPSDVERLVQDRADRLERLRRILGPIPPALSPKRARKNLAEAIAVLDRGKRRPKNKEGAPGGLVELPDDVVPIMVGDLHAEVDNLILVLIEGRTLDRLESGDAALLILGDAVHPEDEEALAEMGSSLLMTDMIARLMVAFPSRVFYLRGNHDSFSEDMTKGGISQGLAWREAVKAHRGKEGVAQMQEFYDRLPYVAVGKGFIACHAGPPRGKVSRKALINVTADSSLMHQLTWNRVQTPRHPGGYTKRDVRGLQKALDHPKSSVLVVSHNPGRDGDTTIRSLGGIKHHDLVYSAKPDRVSIMTRFEGRVVPITYPGSLLLEALAGLPKP